MQENNIDIKSFSYTKGQEFVINSLLSLDIKIELNAFKEFADDILNITTRNLSRNDLGFKARENIFMDFSSKEKTSIVEQALLALLDFKDSLCLLEIKLQILNLGFYLSAKSIIEILEEKDITTKDNIKGILRFAKEFQKLNIIKIEYKEKIPNFNISKDGKIYISKNIKKNFLDKWKEYILYLIQNKITGYISKIPIEENYSNNIELLFEHHPIYAEAFLLDNKMDILNEYGYEIMASIAFTGGKKQKTITN